jgi:hypothetical protein
MTSKVLLRAAAILTFIHAVLHTVGGLFRTPSNGPTETAVIGAMKSATFDFMGSMRSYWDFYFGFGLNVSVTLLIETAILWQLANLASAAPERARPFIATLAVAFLSMAALSYLFFFIAPVLTELLIAGILVAAYLRARSPAASPASAISSG